MLGFALGAWVMLTGLSSLTVTMALTDSKVGKPVSKAKNPKAKNPKASSPKASSPKPPRASGGSKGSKSSKGSNAPKSPGNYQRK